MHHKMSSAFALGIGAALVFATAQPAEAQNTTRDSTRVTSSQRIPIRKGATTAEAGGAVESEAAAEQARQDSIAAAERFRQDSLLAAQRAQQDSIAAVERARQDSIAAAERARQEEAERMRQQAERARMDSIARADSIAAAEAARRRLPRSMYFNIAAGASVPTGTFNDAFKTGFNATASLGWNPPNLPFGLRIDGGYDRLRGRTVGVITYDDANIWSGLAEATLGIPLTVARLSPYVVGGGGVYHFSNYNVGGSGNSTTKGGWNAGGGVTFSFGRTNLFVESRYMRVSTPTDPTTFVPVVLGLTFR
jgi:hypothetical protein